MLLASVKICFLFCVLEQPAAPPPPKVDYLCDSLRQEMSILLKPLGKTGLDHDRKAALDSVRRKYVRKCR